MGGVRRERPGDPGLLTVRPPTSIREAEIVITEGPEHPALVRALLGLPEGPRAGPSSSTAASARTASR
jgi:uroporphyrinogen III methyltransferase/synthase